MRHLIQNAPDACAFPIPTKKTPVLVCWLCNKEIPLEIAKTDEYGQAIHEDCYLLRLHLKEAC